MSSSLETVILESLIHNEDYCRKVMPFLEPEYFKDNAQRIVYEEILGYTSKFNTLPSQSELLIELKSRNGLSQDDFETSVDIVNSLGKKTKEPSIDWLMEHTEKFCKNSAFYNVIVDAAELIDTIDGDMIQLGDIPERAQKALSITFDTSVGLSYSSLDDRFERRKKRKVDKIPFFVNAFNDATNGGMDLKTVACIAASTGAGKSAVMCAQAAHTMLNGKNVLYITLEMDEDSIADRIDANILGISLDDIPNLSKDEYVKRLSKKISADNIGELVIKEYPTSCAGVMEFRSLLNELKIKQNFIPQLVVVDYLNICNSSRVKAGAVNSYTYVKFIAEEMRGLAKEFNCAIFTGTQLNRDGVENTNVSLKEISESSGLSHTVDMLFALIRTEEMDKLNQVMIKQLKNRYADMTKMLRFCIGVDRAKFRYFDVDGSLADDVNRMVADAENEMRQDSSADDSISWSGNFGASKKPKRDFQSLNM